MPDPKVRTRFLGSRAAYSGFAIIEALTYSANLRNINFQAKRRHMPIPIDFSVRMTDLAIVFATLAGPFLAVYVTEQQRKKAETRSRKIHLFRTLMATRSTTLAANHIEALNLVELEFDSMHNLERDVVDAWRIYLAHLNDHNYPRESWEARRADLLIDLLYSMSKALRYPYSKSEIKRGTYYPHGYSDAENDNWMTRKLWLEILKGERSLPMQVSGETRKEKAYPTLDSQ